MGYNGDVSDGTSTSPQLHWDTIFDTKQVDQVSWYQPRPEISLRLIGKFSSPQQSVVDIGSGASFLIDHLINEGYTDLTSLDISEVALEIVKQRVSRTKVPVRFVTSNVLDWIPERTFDVWHDRAVFHFLHGSDRRRYVETCARSIRSGDIAIIGTFSLDGPEQCSGLPVQRYDSDMITEIFGDYFELIESLNEEHQTPFDTNQRFCWTVLRRK